MGDVSSVLAPELRHHANQHCDVSIHTRHGSAKNQNTLRNKTKKMRDGKQAIYPSCHIPNGVHTSRLLSIFLVFLDWHDLRYFFRYYLLFPMMMMDMITRRFFFFTFGF